MGNPMQDAEPTTHKASLYAEPVLRTLAVLLLMIVVRLRMFRPDPWVSGAVILIWWFGLRIRRSDPDRPSRRFSPFFR
jgi:hypothetical protein